MWILLGSLANDSTCGGNTPSVEASRRGRGSSRTSKPTGTPRYRACNGCRRVLKTVVHLQSSSCGRRHFGNHRDDNNITHHDACTRQLQSGAHAVPAVRLLAHRRSCDWWCYWDWRDGCVWSHPGRRQGHHRFSEGIRAQEYADLPNPAGEAFPSKQELMNCRDERPAEQAGPRKMLLCALSRAIH
jgi:hypothetical protein